MDKQNRTRRPRPVVTLTPEHRDALRDSAELDVSGLDDAAIAVRHGDRDYLVRARDKLAAIVELLDALGWEADDPRDDARAGCELPVTPRVARLLARYDREAAASLEDYARDLALGEWAWRCYPPGERAGCVRRVRECVDRDLDTLDACRLVLDARRQK